MKALSQTALELVLAASVVGSAIADGAPLRQTAAIDQCRVYGFAPHTAAYATCQANVRHYWTTGPCADAAFVAIHREYCHLNPPPFL